MLTNVVEVMRNDDHRTITSFLEKLTLALLCKPVISYRDNFIYQKAIEIYDHRKRERKPSTHSGGVVLDRLAEVAAKFTEFLNEVYLLFRIDAVNPTDEAQIVETR